MGMAAGTDEAHYAEAVADWGAAHEVHQGAVIVGMDTAGALCPTAWAGLQFRTESGHEGAEQGF